MKENTWKEIAKQKQLTFKSSLGLTDSGKHGDHYYAHILGDKDASKGAAFYCYQKPEWQELQAWADQDRGKKIDFLNNGLKNILRSEHIAYNIFFPLEKMRQADDPKLNQLIGSTCGLPVDEVTSIRVEYAGSQDKSKYLDDNTSFDSFISFNSNGKKVGLGIEIKYTELSYPYGTTEKNRLYDEQSEYIQLAKRSGYYKDYNSPDLKTKKLKQPFRNHLLGIKMEEIGEVDEFFSVHFYPSGNTYQAEVAKAYTDQLNNSHQHKFINLTFEDFITKAKSSGIKEDWVEYFEKRY